MALHVLQNGRGHWEQCELSAAPAGEEEEEDAWRVFDPHDSSSHVGQPLRHSGLPIIKVVALQDINAGTSFTVDYHWGPDFECFRRRRANDPDPPSHECTAGAFRCFPAHVHPPAIIFYRPVLFAVSRPGFEPAAN